MTCCFFPACMRGGEQLRRHSGWRKLEPPACSFPYPNCLPNCSKHSSRFLPLLLRLPSSFHGFVAPTLFSCT